ncbi:MAG: thioredoxin family protein [Calditrichaceae bacterium]
MQGFLYLILVIVGFFVVMQLYIRISSVMKKGKIVDGVNGKIGKDIKAGKRILVYFYSNSCAACKPMTPIIDKLKKEFESIHTVNLAKDMETARAFGVMGTPATVLVENKKIMSFNLGAKSEVFLRKLLN